MDSETTGTGTCKFWNSEKGWGFLKLASGKDLFCHVSGLIDLTELTEGELVSFQIRQTPKGLQAFGVKRVEATS